MAADLMRRVSWNEVKRMTADDLTALVAAGPCLVTVLNKPTSVIVPLETFDRYEALLQQHFDVCCEAKKVGDLNGSQRQSR